MYKKHTECPIIAEKTDLCHYRLIGGLFHAVCLFYCSFFYSGTFIPMGNMQIGILRKPS